MSWRENLSHFPDPRMSSVLSYQGMTYPGLLQDPSHGYPHVLATGHPPGMSPLMHPMAASPYPQPMLPVGATFPPSSPYVGHGMVGGMLGHPRPPNSPFMSPQSVADFQRSVIPGPDPRLMSPPMHLYSPPPPPLGLRGHRLLAPSPVSIGMPGRLSENPSTHMLPPPPPLKHAPGILPRAPTPSSTAKPSGPEMRNEMTSPWHKNTVQAQLWTPPPTSHAHSGNSNGSREKTDDILALNESYASSTQPMSSRPPMLNSQSDTFKPFSAEHQKPSKLGVDPSNIKRETEEDILDDYRRIGDKYLCNMCNYVSPRTDKILQHIQAHKGKKVCHLCNKAFIKSCDLYRHLERHNKSRHLPSKFPNGNTSESPTLSELSACSPPQLHKEPDESVFRVLRHQSLDSLPPSSAGSFLPDSPPPNNPSVADGSDKLSTNDDSVYGTDKITRFVDIATRLNEALLTGLEPGSAHQLLLNDLHATCDRNLHNSSEQPTEGVRKGSKQSEQNAVSTGKLREDDSRERSGDNAVHNLDENDDDDDEDDDDSDDDDLEIVAVTNLVTKPFNTTTNTDAIRILRENLGTNQDFTRSEQVTESRRNEGTTASCSQSPTGSRSSDKVSNAQDTAASNTDEKVEDDPKPSEDHDANKSDGSNEEGDHADSAADEDHDATESNRKDSVVVGIKEATHSEKSVKKVQNQTSNLQIHDVCSYAGSSSQFDSQTGSAVNSDDDATNNVPLVPLPEYTPIAGNVVDLARFNMPKPPNPVLSPMSMNEEPPMLASPGRDDVLPSIDGVMPKLQKQRKTQHPSDFRCAMCNYEGRSEKSLQKHIRAHNQSYKICRYCRKAFERPSDLLRHEERHENNMQKHDGNPSMISKGKVLGVSGQSPQSCETPEEQMFRCKKCDYITNRFHILVLHQRQRHSTKYNCEYCSMIFISKRALTYHLRHCMAKVIARTEPIYLREPNTELWGPNPRMLSAPPTMYPHNSSVAVGTAVPTRNWPSTTESMPIPSAPSRGPLGFSPAVVSRCAMHGPRQETSNKESSKKDEEQLETKGIGRLDCFKKDILEKTSLVEIFVGEDNEICLSMEPVSENAEHFCESKVPFCSRHTEALTIIDHAHERMSSKPGNLNGGTQIHSTAENRAPNKVSENTACSNKHLQDRRANQSMEIDRASVLSIEPSRNVDTPQRQPSPILISPTPEVVTQAASSRPTSQNVINLFQSLPNTSTTNMPMVLASMPPLLQRPSLSSASRAMPIMVSTTNAFGSKPSSYFQQPVQLQSIRTEPSSSLQIVCVEGNSQHHTKPTRSTPLIQFPQQAAIASLGISPLFQVPPPSPIQKPISAEKPSIVIRIADAVQMQPVQTSTTVLQLKRAANEITKATTISVTPPKLSKITPGTHTHSSATERMYPEPSSENTAEQSYACTDHNYHTSPEKSQNTDAFRLNFHEVQYRRDAQRNHSTNVPKVKKPMLKIIPEVDIKQEPKSDTVQLMRPNVYRHKQLRYYCERCNYGTDEKHKMDEHLRAHEGRFVCKHCNKACIKASDLYRHWVTHNLRAPSGEFICDTCEFTCPAKIEMETHLRVHYVIRLNPLAASHNIATCGICHKKFTRSQLFVHKRLVHSKQARNMTSAAASLRAARGWSSHGRPAPNQPAFPVENTGENTGEVLGSSSASTSYWCPMCNQQFATSTAINNHYDTMHLDNNNIDGTINLDPKILDEASKTSSRNTGPHKSSSSPTKHGRRPKRGARKWGKVHQCQFCHKRFTSIYYKREHERLHTDEKPYSCSKCGERFVLKQACRMHESRNCSIRRQRHHIRASDIQAHEPAYDESTDMDSSPEAPEEVLQSLQAIEKDGESSVTDGAIDPDDLALIQSLPLPAPSIEIVKD